MRSVRTNLQLRVICALALIVLGWMLMFIHSPGLLIWGMCALLFCVDCWSERKELSGQIKSLFSVEAKQNLKNSLVFVLLFTFIAYGFLFANEFFSHDSIQLTVYSNSPYIFQFYLGVGRFFIPLYEVMKGPYSAPWIIGLLFTVWMVLVCFLVIEFFQLKSRFTMVMVSGLLCTNTALVLTSATYIYCLDEYALSLLASVAAAYCFCKVPYGKLTGVLLMILSLGIYQTYFAVTCVLCFIFAVQRLVKNDPAAKVIGDGLKQAGLVLISVGIYFVLWTALCGKFQVAKNRTEEMIFSKGLSEIITVLVDSYRGYFNVLFNTHGLLGYLYASANIFIILLLVWKLFCLLRKGSIGLSNKCCVVVLMLFAPFVFSSSRIVLAGNASELASYAYELIYIFLLVWLDWDKTEKDTAVNDKTEKVRVAAVILLGCIVYNNVLLANQAYMKKDLEKTATISLVTRMIERVETLEGYSIKDTPVYVVGDLWYSDLNHGKIDVPCLETRAGLWSNYSATYNLVQYVTDYLNYPMNIAIAPELNDRDEVRDMPAFPAAGSVKMIDGAAVIKLSQDF